MPDYYRDVIIETYPHSRGGSKHPIRARPIPGQNLPSSMNVECSWNMRKKYPIGTLLKVRAKIKCTTQKAQLYTYFDWPHEVVSSDEAKEFIERKIWRESKEL